MNFSGAAPTRMRAARSYRRAAYSILDHERASMKITNLKCTVLGQTPVVRITTDQGISGLGPVESYKPYLAPHVGFYKEMIVGEDPTNVEQVMRKIRNMGAFKPWGSAVSAIEI